MALLLDDVVEAEYAGIVARLRAERRNAGLTQEVLALRLPVAGRAISEWETGVIEPTLTHLLQWCRALGYRLVIVERGVEVPLDGLVRRSGETWEVYERRRLVQPLRNRRLASKCTQARLAVRVGVSQFAVGRWEVLRCPPRPRSHIRWARSLGCSLALRPLTR